MTILVDGQVLSVTDLFKKYDLDEISDILVKVKKEIFARTNEVKKVIGSNPDLMIEFGENVLNIYNTSSKLNSSTSELLKDIEKFSSSLGERVSNFIQEELPDVILKEDLDSILGHQEQYERLYFGILESFSKKSFIQSYELYLEYKLLLSKDSSDSDNSIFKDDFFIKQSISSNCYTYIQSCDKLTSVELSQLIMIRYLLEIEDRHSNDDLQFIEQDFKSILETALILRVENTIQSLKCSRITNNQNHEDDIRMKEEYKERLSQSFMMAMTVLVDLYELKESILIVFSDFKQRGWYNFQSLENISACTLSLNDDCHIKKLLSVLIEEFESMRKEKVIETNHIEDDNVCYNKQSENIKHSFRFKFLSRIYLSLFNTVKHGIGIEILRSSFFPILISTIEEDLLQFLLSGNKNQLFKLILRSEEEIETFCNKKTNNIFEDTNAVKWLISKNDSFEILLEEIKVTGEFLDKVEPLEKNSILTSISEKCIGSLLNKFIEFNRSLFWTIKGKDCKQSPRIIVNNEENDSFSKFHKLSNILIQGKQLDVLESYLMQYLSTGQEELGLYHQALTQENIGHSSINWKALVLICNEISAAIEDFSQNTQESKHTQTLMLSSLGEFAKSYISSEYLVKHAQKIRILNTILYSLMIHREDLCQKICTYQSLLHNVMSNLNKNCLNPEEILPLTSLYHQFGFLGDNSVTPHTLLIEFCFNLNVIAKQLNYKSQKYNFKLVCKSFIQSYIIPFQVNTIKAFSDFYFKLQNSQEDESPKNQLKADKEQLFRCISCLYSDLIWCRRFSVLDSSKEDNEMVNNLDSSDELSPTIDLIKTILSHESLDSIENGVLKLLKESQQDYNLEECNQLPKVQDLFANSVQRFPTLPLVKSSRGSISNKIAIANDKTLKAYIDSNSVSNNDDISQFLLNHYSNILKNYNKSDSIRVAPKFSSVINSQEAINNINSSNPKEEKATGWFSMGIGQQNEESSPKTYSNDNNSSSFINNNGSGGMRINKKIDTQAIWQVSNLLKETVKDRVFGQ